MSHLRPDQRFRLHRDALSQGRRTAASPIKIDYLTGDREESFIVAQANAPIDEKGQLHRRQSRRPLPGRLSRSRADARSTTWTSRRSSSSRWPPGLIPFLEHDDANRALMGSNMQRQGVPLLVSESPLVGTGHGRQSRPRFARRRSLRRSDGKVASVTADQIIITKDGEMPEGKKKLKHDPEEGMLSLRTAQVHALQRRHLRQPEADREERPERSRRARSSPTARTRENGELALGRNVLVAFMPWNGYNFEDAITISREGREGGHLHLDPHRRIRDRRPRHQARTGRNHARYSERLAKKRCATSARTASFASARK